MEVHLSLTAARPAGSRAPDKNSPSPVDVEVLYARKIVNPDNSVNCIRDSVRARFDPNALTRVTLKDPAEPAEISVNFLGSDGTVRFAKTVNILKIGQEISVELDQNEMQTLTQLIFPSRNKSLPDVRRKARLVPKNNQPVDFGSTKGFYVISDKSTIVSKLGPQIGGISDNNQSFRITDSLYQLLMEFNWTPFAIGSDGGFSVNFPNPEISRPEIWLWMSVGKYSAFGTVLEDTRSDVKTALLHYAKTTALFLPEFPVLEKVSDSGNSDCSGCSDSSCGKTSLSPLPNTESEITENPGIYMEDPGQYCSPFSNPERVISEKAVNIVLRTEQPAISGMASSKLNEGTLVDFDTQPQPVRQQVVARSTGTNAKKTGTGEVKTLQIGKTTSQTETPVSGLSWASVVGKFPSLSKFFGNILNASRSRGQIDADNPVQWESDSAVYQASTVARGHILEYRIRQRSNGYSLGQVVKTLTLAPRQTKRIQKVVWKRSETEIRSEMNTQTDETNDSLTRDRSYDDVISSNLSEWSYGESESSMSGAAIGAGFAIGSFVIGGGAVTSDANSSSMQEGCRNISASEEQRLRDSIRRHGDAVRNYKSVIVNEMSQEETSEGSTEIIRNQNYAHALTVVYHQILKHYRVETEFSGFRECLFVPFAIKPFTMERVYRWRDSLRRGLRDPRYSEVFRNLKDIMTGFLYSDVPEGKRCEQPLQFIKGTLYIRLGIDRPKDKEGKLDETAWDPFRALIGFPLYGIFQQLTNTIDSMRDSCYQEKFAPTHARNWVNNLKMTVGTDKIPVNADFTMTGEYRYGSIVRVDFNARINGQTSRSSLSPIIITSNDDLPFGSRADVTSCSLTYSNRNYQYSAQIPDINNDLIDPDGKADKNGAYIQMPNPTAWEEQDIRQELRKAASELLLHLNEHLEYYHKVIWWNMDRDRIYMLMDGFFVPGTNYSIASVIERDPVAIIGNSLVFRVSSGLFLGEGQTTRAQVYDYYKDNQLPRDPLLVSVPTDGLYAQGLMDECVTLESHYGSLDWALTDPDPDLTPIDAELLKTRRADTNQTPTQMQPTIINLQSTPDAPSVSGLSGVLQAVTSANSFRDMAGLAGTQGNAATAANIASGLATSFGNQAASLKLAQIQADKQATESASQKLEAINKAKNLTKEDKASLEKDALSAMTGSVKDNGESGLVDTIKKSIDSSVRTKGGKKVSATVNSGTSQITTTVEPAGSTTSAVSGNAEEDDPDALPNEPVTDFSYEIPGLMVPLTQSKEGDCWAVVATMMQSWKDQSSYSVDDIMTKLGDKYKKLYRDDSGLDVRDHADLFGKMEMVSVVSASFPISTYRDLLMTYGPLWVITDAGDKTVHALILTGMVSNGDDLERGGDGSATTLHVIDPSTGGVMPMSFAEFIQGYEAVAFDTGKPLMIQIAHFPSGPAGMCMAGQGSNAADRIAYAQSLIGLKSAAGEDVVYGQKRGTAGELVFDDAKMDCSEFVLMVLKQTSPLLYNSMTVDTAPGKERGGNTVTIRSGIETVTGMKLAEALRQDNPLIGDIALWSHHVELISDVQRDSQGNINLVQTIGAGGHGKVPRYVNARSLKSMKGISAGFLGFWTPPEM